MSQQPLNLRRFVLLLFPMLAICFSLWWSLSGWLASPALSASEWLLAWWLPDSFHLLQQKGATGLIFSTLGELNGQLMSAQAAKNYLAFEFNTQILSFSLPFFCALTFAAPGNFSLEHLLEGIAALYAVFVISVAILALKTLMVGLGPQNVVESQGSLFLNINTVALLYQVCTLILPILIPVLIWVAQKRHLLAPHFNRIYNPS